MSYDIYQHIGRRIREERVRRGWTQEQLADKIEVHTSFIGQLERGLKKPSLVTLKKLADIFGIKAGDLLAEGPPPKAQSLQRGFENLLQGYSLKQQAFLYDVFRRLARQFKKFPPYEPGS